MSSNYMINPWSPDFWQQLFRSPLSGDVAQEILPSWFSTHISVSGLGEPELEQKIFMEVATYGKQLGELTDVVLSLVDAVDMTEGESLQELRAIAEQVALKKEEYRKSAQQRAALAMQELAHADPEGLSQLISSFQERIDSCPAERVR